MHPLVSLYCLSAKKISTSVSISGKSVTLASLTVFEVASEPNSAVAVVADISTSPCD